jgi:hypothetical protein
MLIINNWSRIIFSFIYIMILEIISELKQFNFFFFLNLSIYQFLSKRVRIDSFKYSLNHKVHFLFFFLQFFFSLLVFVDFLVLSSFFFLFSYFDDLHLLEKLYNNRLKYFVNNKK